MDKEITVAQNVILENFSIDFDFCRYCQGEVISSNEEGFELKINRNTFYCSLNEAGNVVFKSGNEYFSTADLPILIGNTIFSKPPWDYIFAGQDTLCKDHLPTTHIQTDAVETENGLKFLYRPDSRRLNLELHDTLFFIYEPRANINILLQECSNIQVRHVSMSRSGGMGLVCEYTKDILIDDLQVKVPENRQDSFTLTADAMFFSNCSGQITVRNSYVEKTMDDALNIHGFYSIVQEIRNKNTLVLTAGLDSHGKLKPGFTGDELLFYRNDTHEPITGSRIKNISLCSECSYLVELTDGLEGVSPGDLVKNASHSADFVFENNHIFRCPHLRISNNGKRLIRNNIIEECHAILVNDLIEYWREAGSVDDLVIENNSFINTPRFNPFNGAVCIQTTRKPDCSIRHKNILIRNNRFNCATSTQVQIRVEHADDVTICGNTFNTGKLDSLICTDDCHGLTLKENQIRQEE